ncbi:MAG: hypothetical protein HKN18_15060 [Silicimonas sp.]|nr:hypothetical protein [Silicimonas sp.]
MNTSQIWNWDSLVDAIAVRFPGTCAKDLLALDRDSLTLLRHLALTNDLTMTEAEEIVAVTRVAHSRNADRLHAA